MVGRYIGSYHTLDEMDTEGAHTIKLQLGFYKVIK